MARTDQQFPLRLPPELKEKLENACKESGRSKNAEAVYRLEQSFLETTGKDEELEFLREINQKHSKDIDKLISMVEQLLEERGNKS